MRSRRQRLQIIVKKAIGLLVEGMLYKLNKSQVDSFREGSHDVYGKEEMHAPFCVILP